jgi:hypothetical protein
MLGVHGSSARLYINDFDLSSYAEEVGQQIDRAVAEHLPLNGTFTNRAAGIKSVSLNVGGSAYAPATGGNDAFHWEALSAADALVYAFVPGGDVLGLHAYCGTVRQNNATISAPGDDFVRVPFALLGNARLDRAVILRAMAAAGTSPGTAVNNGSATADGGRGFLLCPALSAGATLTVLVQDSADGTTDWQTILGFTALTAKGSQALEIPDSGGNVPITGVSIGDDELVVDGDYTLIFPPGTYFRVNGSTGNDGTWLVDSVSYSALDDETTITVTGDITNATVDGNVEVGTVRQYTRVSWSLAGAAPTATWFCAFARF